MTPEELTTQITRIWIELHNVPDPVKARMADLVKRTPRELFDKPPRSILRRLYTMALQEIKDETRI